MQARTKLFEPITRTCFLLSLTLAAVVGAASAGDAGQVSMIVRADNPIQVVSREDVVRIFLGQRTTWTDGARVRPVDQSLTSPVRKQFSNEVLGQALIVIESYWRQRIFAGRAAPPPVRETDAAVVEFVSANPGAIGYVRAGLSLPRDVKAVAVSD